jgi:glycosyltransferase involved in cell wall biosynthesis
MDRHRIAFLISALSGGGAERATVELASALDPAAFEVTLILERDREQFYPVAPHLNIEVLGVSRSRETPWPLVRTLKRLRPHALYAALPHLNALAVIASRMVRPRPAVVVSVHNNHTVQFTEMHDGRTHRLVTPWVYRAGDEIVAVSTGVAQQVAATPGVPERKVHVIYNPIDIASARRDADEKLDHPWFASGEEVVVGVGRLTTQKDFPMLLRAFAVVTRHRPQARLVILGDGEDRGELEDMARSLQLTESVQFLGLRANPFAYLARSRCFALSSRYEGFGMVIVEAMAVGTAVVSTDCPFGPAEILENGRSGLLSPPGDSDLFAQALLKVLADDSLESTLVAEGHRRARDFDTSIIAPQLAELLAGLAVKRGQPSPRERPAVARG